MPAILDRHGRPFCRLHGLRMLNPAIFTRCPFASADSTNAAVNGGREQKQHQMPAAWQRANRIADWIETHNSAPAWCREATMEALYS